MTTSVRYYFAYNSPYAFLANTRVVEALSGFDVELDYRPWWSPPSKSGGPDINSPKIQYIFEDAGRFAEAYGIELDPGPFANTRHACIGFLYARDQGRGREYHDLVYRARWQEGGDLGDDEVLAGIAEAAGLDAAGLRAATADAKYEQALARINEEAGADGVFGVPTFVYEGERFWGNDRIEWLVRRLERA